jgi:hypothetical protein
VKSKRWTDDRRRTPSDGKSSYCLWQDLLKRKIAHFVPIGYQTWPPHAILVSDRLISKKSSPLKLLSHMNRNLVGSIYMYGSSPRFLCRLTTQSWRSKSAVFRMHISLTSRGSSKIYNAVRRQRNLGLVCVGSVLSFLKAE